MGSDAVMAVRQTGERAGGWGRLRTSGAYRKLVFIKTSALDIWIRIQLLFSLDFVGFFPVTYSRFCKLAPAEWADQNSNWSECQQAGHVCKQQNLVRKEVESYSKY